MKKAYDYDLIVIGGGIAGMVSAVTACSLGKRVALVEKSEIGGNCTHFTCIPSKVLIQLGHLSRQMKRLGEQGLWEGSGGALDRGAVMAHIRNVVQKAREKDRPETFEDIGIRVIAGSAAFIDPHRVRINGNVLSAAKFIIAAGTSPLIPEIDGIGDIVFLTNENLYGLHELPSSLLILGGGVDGLEYASAFRGLGVETTVVGTATRVLPEADPELVERLLRELRDQGIRLLTGAVPEKLYMRGDQVALRARRRDGGEDEIVADRLLVTVGRKPQLEGLSLENAGVRHDSRRVLCDRTLRTSAPHIFACGDIVGPYQLASTAEAQGILAATNAFLPLKRTVDYRNSVFVIFTDPPLAYLGLTEERARVKLGRKTNVYRFEYSNMRRALIDGRNTGMAKVVCDGRGRILGVHLLGEAAGEVIHEFAAMKTWKKPLHRLSDVSHAYPTYAQALAGRAGQLALLDKMGRDIFVRLGLRLLPGVANRLNLARDRLAETPLPSPGSPPKGAVHVAAGIPLDAPCKTAFPAGSPGLEAGGVGLRDLDGGILVMDLRGVLDAGREAEISRAFGEAFRRSRNVLLNFSAVSHMDPEAAGLLVVNFFRAARRGLGVEVCGLSDAFRAVFRLTRLDEAMPVFGDEGEAVSSSPGLFPAGPVPLPGWASPRPAPLAPQHARGRREPQCFRAADNEPNSRFRPPVGQEVPPAHPGDKH